MTVDYGLNVSVQTTRRRRNEFELCGRIAQKNPLLSDKNFKKSLQFDAGHIHKGPNMIVWSDESMIIDFGSDGKHSQQIIESKIRKKTIKYAGALFMV